MRPKAIRTGILLAGLCVAAVAAQSDRPERVPAPTKEAKVWSAADVKARGMELLKTKANNYSFFSETAYNAELRNLTGKQPVLQHIKRGDFMVILEGGGTFTTGGELVNSKLQNPNGDLTAEGSKGGVNREVKAGDVVFVPPGVAHYFSNIPDHVLEILVRWDVK